MVTASAGVSYSHVAVEWVNNDVFYVELAQPNQNRVSHPPFLTSLML